MAQVTGMAKPLTKADILVFNNSEPEYQQVQRELQQLEQQKNQLLTMMNAFNERQKNIIKRVEKLETSYNALGAAPADISNPDSSLINATNQLRGINFSFNLQYLQLQNQMQNENRSYTAVNNIMKRKHDTVKNSISNVR
ncbi:MAG: hypothetical protein ACJ75B_19870 [Flavisolibacter sp.]